MSSKFSLRSLPNNLAEVPADEPSAEILKLADGLGDLLAKLIEEGRLGPDGPVR
jgi:hypothetical protein